jgi:putative transposase
MAKPDPFRGFHSNPEVIREAVILYVRFPLSFRNVEHLLRERGIDVSQETVRFWSRGRAAACIVAGSDFRSL